MRAFKRAPYTRRAFLRNMTRSASMPLVSGLLTACGSSQPASEEPHAGHDAMPMATPEDAMSADHMDAMHEAGVKAFLAGVDTGAHGNQPLVPRIEQGVKVFDITAQKTQWQTTPGQQSEAWAYNGQVPGPQIRVNVTNQLDESTVVHWHGVQVPNAMDGVSFMTQPPIKPGQMFTYAFTIRNTAGSYMYHAHHNSATQVGKGLLGAFIIEPKDRASEPAYDQDYICIISDQLGGFTINGKGFPATQKLVAKQGQKIRIRYMNQGELIHPMHLHGMPQQVFARDGYLLAQPYLADTVLIAPGERWDVLVACTEVGIWALHCHVLSHAESAHGMFGMTTALVVEA